MSCPESALDKENWTLVLHARLLSSAAGQSEALDCDHDHMYHPRGII